ncbi:MAG: hypothetical protein ACFB11_07805 [Paracoccaceae bacterium]
MRVFVMVVFAALAAGGVSAQDQYIGGYWAHIGPQDYYNSSGTRLTDAAAILRQDRANFHRFGIRHPRDESDPWFGTQNGRAAMPAMIANAGGVPAYIQNLMWEGRELTIYVSMYQRGGFTYLRAEIPG